MKEFVKLPEGVDVDLQPLVDEWNRQYNGMKVAVTEEVSTKARQELLTKYGLENEDAIKSLIDKSKNIEATKSEEYTQLQKEVETLKENLSKSSQQLQRRERLDVLKNAKIREDRLDKAYKLIETELSDDVPFEDAVKKFVEEMPEFVATEKPTITFGEDRVKPPQDDETKVDDLW